MNKFKQVMKDEEGLTLVELLAVVVIMAIIAGIAAVSISRVIQRTREDAQVSNVQQMLASANLNDIDSDGGIKDNVTLQDLEDDGSIKQVSFLENEKFMAEIKFNKDDKGIITMTLPEASLRAGKKLNKGQDINENQAGGLTREQLFETGVDGTTPAPGN